MAPGRKLCNIRDPEHPDDPVQDQVKEGVTPYRIAKDLGVDPTNIYSWKSGRSKPNGTHLLELLRRAGRLAAAVFVGAFVGVISAPQDEGATTLLQAKGEKILNNQTTVYYAKLR